MPDKKQELLKMLNTLDEERLTKTDFTSAFRHILEIIINKESKLEQAVAKLEETYHTLLSKMNNDHSSHYKELKGQVDNVFVGERLDAMAREHKSIMATIQKDTESAFKEKTQKMEERVAQLKPMKGERGDRGDMGPMPTEHLDLMRQVRAELKKVQDILTNIPRGKTVGRAKAQVVRAQNLTSMVDGVVNTFTLDPDTTAVLGVFGTQFPANFNAGVDWTFAGRTLTLVIAQVGIPQSGQTLWALTEVLFYP